MSALSWTGSDGKLPVHPRVECNPETRYMPQLHVVSRAACATESRPWLSDFVTRPDVHGWRALVFNSWLDELDETACAKVDQKSTVQPNSIPARGRNKVWLCIRKQHRPLAAVHSVICRPAIASFGLWAVCCCSADSACCHGLHLNCLTHGGHATCTHRLACRH